jgi:23S rRNA pseudouridine2605 synthase
VAGRHVSRQVGLARALSKLGYCSRSRAFELIRAGRVGVNGAICRRPTALVRPDRDRIEVDGQQLPSTSKIYLVMNKLRGTVTTASDDKGRETVYAFLDRSLPWVAPVGRLDKASEGLLLLTNDSKWAARVLAPETHLNKTYHVQVAGIGDDVIERIRHGVIAENGDRLRAKHARILRRGSKHSWLEIVLDEGKNRHIRRMLESLEVRVLRLVRVAIGPLCLGDLPKGNYRPLSRMEKQTLDTEMRKRRDRAGHAASPPELPNFR